MDRSQYLVAALQGLQAPPPQAPTQSLDLAAMAEQAKRAKDWRAANPGQSYIGHNLAQARDRIGQIPDRLKAIPGQLRGLFGLGAGGA